LSASKKRGGCDDGTFVVSELGKRIGSRMALLGESGVLAVDSGETGGERGGLNLPFETRNDDFRFASAVDGREKLSFSAASGGDIKLE
jgi:hypothetical protein